MAGLSVSLFKKKNHTKQIREYLFSVPFIVYLLFWPSAYDRLEAGNFMLRSLPIFIAPILVLKSSELIDFRKFRMFFVYGTITMVLYCYLMGFVVSFESTFLIKNFTYYQFASYVSLHPTYAALIILCALIFLSYETLIKPYLLNLAFTLLFISALLMLQIRSAIFMLAILSVVKLVIELKRQNLGNVLMFIGIISVITFVAIKQKRFSTLFVIEQSNNLGTKEDNGITQRIWLWEMALKQAKNKPIFGYGLRSQRSLFHKQVHKRLLAENLTYRERISMMLNAKKNFHNQYLQWLYDFGFVGLLVLVASLLYLLVSGLKTKNNLFSILLLVFSFMMITENLMDRQSGLYFYAVILPLLFSEKS